MSTKASGSLIVTPDSPVVRYSAEMDSCFEMLHRIVSRGLRVPDAIDFIVGYVRMCRDQYYFMRDYLESDYGISAKTAAAYPKIELGPILKKLYAWETDSEVGRAEYNKRNVQLTSAPLLQHAEERFLSYDDCWKQYRLWLFEANRALEIARNRVASTNSESA